MQGVKMAGGLVTAALLLALTAAPVTIAQDTDATAAEQPATPLAGPGLLEPLGIDIRASTELGPEELQARIDKLTAALDQPELPDESKAQLTALLEADRAELAQRETAAGTGDAATQTAQPAEDGTTEQPAAAAEEAAPPPPEPAAEAAPAETATQQAEEQPAQDQPAEPVAEQPAETAPAEGTADTGTESTPAVEAEPAPPPPAAETATDQPATDAAAAAPAETPSVDAPPEVDPAAETKAAALLADNTPVESLSDDALKARVEQYRDLLGEADLSRKTAKALRQRLKADREALRARVAAQEAAEAEAAAQQQAATQQQAAPAAEQTQQQTQGATTEVQSTATPDQKSKAKTQQQALTTQPSAADAPESAPLEIAPLLPMVIAPTVAEIPMLLQDQRPADSLADDELNRRILATRQALQDKQDYSQEDLTGFDRQLRADRQELNDRLLEDRQQRAAAYKTWKNPNLEINTEPEMGEPEAPTSIFAAEVDDAEMWDQIVMAPLEPITRRYSRWEVVNKPDMIMNQPEVREAMPSIELDTITFGFNEAFVREEEIFDLDRIARMIESVVAAHPDEIFMIEGHTDAVGSDAYNLKLSRQRAQAVKTALSRYYVIPPQNLATVGLGERYLKIWTPEAEEENRRVTVRRVTPLVEGYDAD